MRIGIFGGSFDPPHRGHLAVALAGAETFRLRRVLLMPTGIQPLKPGELHASYADRFAMTEILCEEAPAVLQTSAEDAPHADGSANYTVDVLRAMQHPSHTLYTIVGADSFLTLRQWKEPEALLSLSDWIVVSRPGFALDDLSALQLTAEQRQRVHMLPTVHVPVSATAVRTRVAQGDDCTDALLPGVSAYIRLHHLYKTGA